MSKNTSTCIQQKLKELKSETDFNTIELLNIKQ